MDTMKRLQKARAGLILGQPFFGALALGQKLVQRLDLPTMGTDGKNIYYNPAFVDGLTAPELEGVFAHEVMHCAMLHHTRRQARDPGDYNRACDYVVNDMLLKSGFTLPADRLHDPAFAGKTSEEVYRIIHDPNRKGGGQGQGNGGAGKPGSDPGGCGEVLDAPGTDGQPATASEIAQAEQDAKIATVQAATAAKACGKLPADIARLVEEMLDPQVDWRTVLRDFVDRTARNDYSWSRPSSRYMAAGLYMPSLLSQETGEIVVAVDTSGSIGRHELAVFEAESRDIFDSVKPERIHVIYCDSAVAGMDSFDSLDDFEMHHRGGGGTAFAPVFRHIEAEGIEPVCCVYLTDLCGSDFGPDPGFPVIWCSTMEGRAPWGEVLRIEL